MSNVHNQAGTNGNRLSIEASKDCSERFVATLRGEVLTRESLLSISLLRLRRFGAHLQKRSCEQPNRILVIML